MKLQTKKTTTEDVLRLAGVIMRFPEVLPEPSPNSYVQTCPTDLRSMLVAQSNRLLTHHSLSRIKTAQLIEQNASKLSVDCVTNSRLNTT